MGIARKSIRPNLQRRGRKSAVLPTKAPRKKSTWKDRVHFNLFKLPPVANHSGRESRPFPMRDTVGELMSASGLTLKCSQRKVGDSPPPWISDDSSLPRIPRNERNEYLIHGNRGEMRNLDEEKALRPRPPSFGSFLTDQEEFFLLRDED